MKGGVRGSPGFLEYLDKMNISRADWIIQDDFFADLATQWVQPGTESDLYKLTNVLWEAFVAPDENVACLMYPSVQHNLHAFNVALKNQRAKVIRAVEAWVIDVEDIVDHPAPGERVIIGPVTHRGEVADDGSVDWSVGNWALEDVRAEFRERIGPAPDFADAPPILKYSEDEIAGSRARAYARPSIKFGGYTWER